MPSMVRYITTTMNHVLIGSDTHIDDIDEYIDMLTDEYADNVRNNHNKSEVTLVNIKVYVWIFQ